LENLIPTPKDTAERQKMGIFGWSSEKAHLVPKFKFKSYVGISNKLLPAI
jgi:hypothetical protein